MQMRIQRGREGLVLPIPSALAAETGLTEHSLIELECVGDRLVITPAVRKATPEDLLRGITPESLHGEWDTGPDVGKEVL